MAAAVKRAEADPGVHVIVLQGAGRAFCAGYDLKIFAEDGAGTQLGRRDAVWDPIKDYALMKRNTDDFFSLWRSLKPTICQGARLRRRGRQRHRAVLRPGRHGRRRPHRLHARAGLGLPHHGDVGLPARRRARQADAVHRRHHRRRAPPPSGAWCSSRCRAEELDARVEALADRIAGVPTNQLAMQKLMINQAYDNMGLHGTQILATLFDGITRHSPEGRWFQQFAAAQGFQAAVEWRDSGRWIPEGGGPVPSREDLED